MKMAKDAWTRVGICIGAATGYFWRVLNSDSLGWKQRDLLDILVMGTINGRKDVAEVLNDPFG